MEICVRRRPTPDPSPLGRGFEFHDLTYEDDVIEARRFNLISPPQRGGARGGEKQLERCETS